MGVFQLSLQGRGLNNGCNVAMLAPSLHTKVTFNMANIDSAKFKQWQRIWTPAF